MDKPLTVARGEFMTTIVNAVNEARLPAFVIAEVLTQALTVVRERAEIEYKNDLDAYNKALKESEEQ